jgi:hypothetical protein
MLYQKNLATLLTLTHLAEKWPHRLVKTRSAKNFIRNAMKTKALLQMIQDGDVEPTLRLLNLQLHTSPALLQARTIFKVHKRKLFLNAQDYFRSYLHVYAGATGPGLRTTFSIHSF